VSVKLDLGATPAGSLAARAPQPPRPMYLQSPEAPAIFAVLHEGAHPRSHTAVLICPPFGWEDMCCYRIRREWAEHLARAGHTTLRIDLPGSGDSAGAPTDPGRLEAWTQAVNGAACWLRRAPHVERVAVIGISLGGLVACRAALRGAPIDELVLWSVPARGRTLLRELRAFSAFEVANAPEAEDGGSGQGAPGESAADGDAPRGGATGGGKSSGESAPGGESSGESAPGGEPSGKGAPGSEPVDDGTLATNGYLMSAETVLALRGLDLAQVEPSATRVRRALLLGRDGMKVGEALPEALASAGAEVTVADGPGYGAMMVEPQDARTPIEVIERVSSWLEEGEPRGEASSAEAEPEEERVHPVAHPAPRSEVTDHEEIVIHHAGVALRERPMFLDGPDGPLFGVLAEPLGARRELTALLLNAGPQRRIGPNRMWVEIARRWAAAGVPTLRLDAVGIGDSDGDATMLARVAEFYRPTYAEQAHAALEALAERGLPQRFVMVGLCAGAYWSVQTALADERVAAVIMLNPRTLVFDEWRHTARRTRQLREKALRASTWRKVLRGEIKVAKHLETGRTLVGRAVTAPARARERIAAPLRGGRAAPGPTREPIEELFDALRERGQRGLLLFTGKEVLRRELTQNGVLDRIDRWSNLELAIRGTSADTHTLTPVWLQRQVHALVDRVLEDELERLPEASRVSSEASHGLPEASQVPSEASHGLPEASQVPSEASHGLPEASQVPSEASHGLPEASRVPPETSHV
jgi:alpha-beta hydrolase superfamily lysophospholipase